jgi:hypothetical protein
MRPSVATSRPVSTGPLRNDGVQVAVKERAGHVDTPGVGRAVLRCGDMMGAADRHQKTKSFMRPSVATSRPMSTGLLRTDGVHVAVKERAGDVDTPERWTGGNRDRTQDGGQPRSRGATEIEPRVVVERFARHRQKSCGLADASGSRVKDEADPQPGRIV